MFSRWNAFRVNVLFAVARAKRSLGQGDCGDVGRRFSLPIPIHLINKVRNVRPQELVKMASSKNAEIHSSRYPAADATRASMTHASEPYGSSSTTSQMRRMALELLLAVSAIPAVGKLWKAQSVEKVRLQSPKVAEVHGCWCFGRWEVRLSCRALDAAIRPEQAGTHVRPLIYDTAV